LPGWPWPSPLWRLSSASSSQKGEAWDVVAGVRVCVMVVGDDGGRGTRPQGMNHTPLHDPRMQAVPATLAAARGVVLGDRCRRVCCCVWHLVLALLCAGDQGAPAWKPCGSRAPPPVCSCAAEGAVRPTTHAVRCTGFQPPACSSRGHATFVAFASPHHTFANLQHQHCLFDAINASHFTIARDIIGRKVGSQPKGC
jgi:hypothetical protein